MTMFKSASLAPFALTALLSLGLTACSSPEGTNAGSAAASEAGTAAPSDATSAPATSTPATSDAATSSAASSEPLSGTLRVMTHDSFNLSDGMLDKFMAQTGVKVELVKAGDAGAMLSRLILTKEAPLADVVYGLDNSQLPRARAEGLLEAYRSPALDGVPAEYRLDEGGLLNTVDYGTVALNYDRAAWEKTGLPLPKTLDDLAQPDYASRLVVPNPTTSSPGLAFLLATINELGEDGAWQWWNKAKGNGMNIVSGWEQAYNTEFSRNGGKYPLVLSYGSSPAAEVYYAEGYDPSKVPAEGPTANLFIPGTTYLQLEGAGLIKGGQNQAAAKAFIDWLLSPEVQKDIPLNMWVYPAVTDTPLDPVFSVAEKAEVPAVRPELLENPQTAVDAWVENVERK